jgi:hypothetical protein
VVKQRQPPWQICGSFVELQLAAKAATNNDPMILITVFDIPVPQYTSDPSNLGAI